MQIRRCTSPEQGGGGGNGGGVTCGETTKPKPPTDQLHPPHPQGTHIRHFSIWMDVCLPTSNYYYCIIKTHHTTLHVHTYIHNLGFTDSWIRGLLCLLLLFLWYNSRLFTPEAQANPSQPEYIIKHPMTALPTYYCFELGRAAFASHDMT
jgi:hypothetical protein